MKLLYAIAIIVVALGLGLWRWTPPAAVDGPPDTFSAFRARRVQEEVAKIPHPTGSPEAARVRDYLVEKLKADGYETAIERDFSCGRHGTCAWVENVVGRRGSGRGAVLIAAHYDSVAAAPGASDDGIGVAAVAETARALTTGPLARPIVALFTDGEEPGLLGAEAFARRHAKEIFAVINCDARGTTGASMMFQASGKTSFVVPIFSSGTSRPVSTSLFAEIYKHMPNDTDFTVFQSFGQGMNIANLTGVTRYHTPLDSISNADPRTLQQDGDSMLNAARAFAAAPDDIRGDEVVWFDVLSFFVARWPATWCMPLALIALALVVGQTMRKRAFGLGLFAALASTVAAALGAYVVGLLLTWMGGAPVGWVAFPAPALISLYVAAIGAGLAVAFFVFRKTSEATRWAGNWLMWAALGLVIARMAPGASYLFVVPALVAGLAGFVPGATSSLIPAGIAAVLWMPISQPIYEATGLFIPAVDALPIIVLVSTLVPLVHEAKRRWFLLPATASVLALLAALLVPPFTMAAPSRTDVIFAQDGDRAEVGVSSAWGATAWGKPPRAMTLLLQNTHDARLVPWGATVPAGDVPKTDQAAPSSLVSSVNTDASHRYVVARLFSPRGATTLALEIPARVTNIRVHGQATTRRGPNLFLRGIGPEGIDITLDATGPEAIPLVVRDISNVLPSSVAPIVAARPWNAVPSQEGDMSVLTSHLSL